MRSSPFSTRLRVAGSMLKRMDAMVLSESDGSAMTTMPLTESVSNVAAEPSGAM